ncbi:integrase, catalytic region, zinc finger, CCHC-type containing protein [Tanacetum coccineum]
MNKNEDLKAKIVSKFEVKTDKSKPDTSCSSPNNKQGQKKNMNVLAQGMYRVMKTKTQTPVAKTNMFSCNSTGVASSSSVKRLESKDTNLNIRVLLNTKSKRTSKDVKKSQSGVSLVFKKHDTKNLNVSKLNANVLKAKIVNDVHDGSNLVCVSCGKDVFMISHDKCVARYALSLNSRVKRALFTSLVVAKFSKLGATPVVAKSKFSVATPKTQQISGCSKHMTGNLKLLRNFVEKFMGTVRFVNYNFAAVTGYGDYFQGNLTICHVYYVEGLEHNLFSVGQFCDEDLEVAFRSNTCYVWNLEGEDLLSGSRDSNLYTMSIYEIAASSPICLMSKATSIKSWLWHIRLSHLNFGTINHLTKQDLVDGLSRFKYDKDTYVLLESNGREKRPHFHLN